MISVYRPERRKLGARKWEETSHTTSHWSSAVMMWMEATQNDALSEFRLIGEWVRTVQVEEVEQRT